MHQECSDSKIFFCTGDSIKIKILDKAHLAGNRHFHGFVLLSLIIMFETSPINKFGAALPWQHIYESVLFNSTSLLSYIISFMVLLKMKGSSFRKTTLICIIFSSLTVAALGYLLYHTAWGAQRAFALPFMAAAYNFFVIYILESLFVIYFLPKAIEVYNSSAVPLDRGNEIFDVICVGPVEREEVLDFGAMPESEGQVLILGGRFIEVKSVRYVSAYEHYLAISTTDGSRLFIRARMKDFISQIPIGAGYFIHRSHWVSWASISDIVKVSHSAQVVLDDDTRLPIARGRRSHFDKQWSNKKE